MNLKKFFSELKRREVYKVAIAYGITAWLIAQISGLVSTSFEFPSWVMQMIITILIVGFPIALILSWVFEVSSKGIKKTTPLTSDGLDEHKPMETRLVIGILVLIGLLMVGGWWTWQKFGFDKSPPIRNLVVLPFDNYTGSDEYEYFVAGMHSSLITDIGRIGELTVKSKTTANSYKETDLSVPEIASELGIDAAVEGSITCMGEDSVCVQIRLVSAYPEEQQLWVQDYRVEKSQILNFYNKVTKTISNQINIVLTPQEESQLAESRTVDREAYDAYLKGRYYWEDLSLESLTKARDYLENAIKVSPDWAAPYAGLAQVWVGLAQMGFESPEIAGPKIMENIEKAIELDPDFPDSHYINGIIAVWTQWNWEKGEKEFLHALAINPSDAMSRIYYAHLLTILRRTDEALLHAKIAQELDPLNPLLLGLYAVVLIDAGECETALAQIEKGLSIEPDHFFTRPKLFRAYKCLGDYEKMFEIWKQDNYKLWEKYGITEHIENVFREKGWLAFQEELIRIHEELYVEDGQLLYPEGLATKYFNIGKYDKILDIYEKMYENHNPNLPYISTRKSFNKLKNNTRYIELLRKMKLPMPEDYQTTEDKRN